MYAIIETGAKQYKVEKDSVIRVEKLDAEIGSKVELKALMLVDDGKIITDATTVKAEVLAHDKANKIVIFRYKAKKNERKKQGHRQPYTALKILDIKA